MRVTINRIEESLFHAICAGAALFGCVILFMILAEITLRALPSLTWYFLSTPESATPGIGMGIANAIWGSVLISLFATVLAIPLAAGTAIYLQKYARDGPLTQTIRFFIEVLSGTPAIVVGIFGLLVLVYYLKPLTGGFSLISGAIALAILIIPVIERSIEEAIHAVPFELEEGSYALGATKWQTIHMVILPTAVSGIITGAILGFGRAAEESAVVILTAGYSQFMPEFAIRPNAKLLFDIKIYPLQDLVGTLPYSVWHAYESSNVIPISNGFAAAVILITFVLCINLSAKAILANSMSGTRRRPGTGCLSTIAATVTGIPARFCRPPERPEEYNLRKNRGTTPDMVWFGIRIPHRSPVHLNSTSAEQHAQASSGSGPEDALPGKVQAAMEPSPDPKPASGPVPEQGGTNHFSSVPQQDVLFKAPAGSHIAVQPAAADHEETSPAPAEEGSANGPAHGSPAPNRYRSLQQQLGALFENRGGHPDADFSMAPITAALSELADLDPVNPPATAMTSSHTVTSLKPRDHSSIMDGSAGVILVFTGMLGFVGLIYGIRFLTKDVSLELGSVILVVLLIAVVLAVASFQYMHLKLRGV